MSLTVTNNAAGGDVVRTQSQYRGKGVYRNLGEVINEAPKDGETEKSAEFGNLEWVRHIHVWVQTDKDYDLVIERNDPGGTAVSVNLAAAQTAPGASDWALHTIDVVPGRSAVFGLKNSESDGDATAGKVRIELFGEQSVTV